MFSGSVLGFPGLETAFSQLSIGDSSVIWERVGGRNNSIEAKRHLMLLCLIKKVMQKFLIFD